MSDDVIYDGFASRCLEFTADEDKAYVTLNLKDLQVSGGNHTDEEVLLIAAGLFKHIMSPYFSIHGVDISDIVIAIELPEKAFAPEVRATFDQRGMMFRLKGGKPENSVPIVKVLDEDEEE